MTPDPARLHRVAFQLRFPTEDAATQAAARLDELAFATGVERDDAEDGWGVLASKRMYPVASDIEALIEKLKLVATEGGGAYSGWSATPLG